MNRFFSAAYVRLMALAVALALTSLLSAASFAQQGTTSIAGDVTDPQGSAIVGAKIVASDAASGVTREATTDEQGHYQFLSLPPGTYVVRATSTGFRNAETSKIEALVNTPQRVNIKMELGSVADTITVTESRTPSSRAPVVSTRSSGRTATSAGNPTSTDSITASTTQPKVAK